MTTDLIQHSVTKNDQLNFDPGTGSPAVLNFFNISNGYNIPFGPLPELPEYWSLAREFVLRRTVFKEAYWSQAIGIAIAKVANKRFILKSQVPLRAVRAHEMFLNANGQRGWKSYIKQDARDFLTSDNGTFTEIVRASSASGSKILGMVHLDSKRCRRTGVPETPVIYRDLNGAEHELQYWQVFSMADMDDSADSFFGIGLCAASRAYDVIRKWAAMERFTLEKVTGGRPLSLEFITGITEKQLQDAINTQVAERKARGGVTYGGVVLIPFMQKEGISHVSVPVQSLPDNFDRQEELNSTLLAYANSIGVDVQDLQPLTGSPLGTSMQSQVLADKADGKGIELYYGELTDKLNLNMLDDSTTFYPLENDYRDQKQKADINKTIADFTDVNIKNGTMTAVQSIQYQVDNDALPKQFLPAPDTTPTVLISNDEKPDLDAQPLPGQPAPPTVAPGSQPAAMLPAGS